MRQFLRKTVAAALEPDQQSNNTPAGHRPQAGYYPQQQYYGSPQQYHGGPPQYYANPQQYPWNPQQYPGSPQPYHGSPQQHPLSPQQHPISPQPSNSSQQHVPRRPVAQTKPTPPPVPPRPWERSTQPIEQLQSSSPDAWLQGQSISELALVPTNSSASPVRDTALSPVGTNYEATRTDSASSIQPRANISKVREIQDSPAHTPAAQVDQSPQMIPDATDGRPAKPKVLCLDGGGVRGYSEIIMLEFLMQQLNGQRGFDLEPWQEFDLIVGTSTGGLLAIMLGRLQMSVAQCKQAYADLMGQVFEKSRADWNKAGKAKDLWNVRGKFSATALEKGIMDLLGRQGVDVDELMWEQNPKPNACKVVVCAVDQTSGAEYIRTFKNMRRSNDLLSYCKIWQAGRATSAASTFFDPIEIGPDGRVFADGGLRNNNPIDAAYSEARDLFPGLQDQLIFVTLGTGVEVPIADMNVNLQVFVDVMKNIVTETEHTYQRFYDNHPEMVQNRLHRFNVPQGLATVGLEEHARRRDVVNFTLNYCKRSDAADAFRRCAESLVQGGQRSNWVGGDRLAAFQRMQAASGVDVSRCQFCQLGIKFNSRVFTCQLCRRDFCVGCRFIHDSSHHEYTCGVKTIQWQADTPNQTDTAVCVKCSASTKARVQCKDCNFSACLTCSWEADAPSESIWAKHVKDGHKEYTYIMSPYDRVLVTSTPRMPSAIPPSDIFYVCNACDEPLRIRDRWYECHTCKVEYDQAPMLCVRCYEDEPQAHRTAHSFRSFRLQPQPFPDSDLAQLKLPSQCNDCGTRFPAVPTEDHPHFDYTIFIGPLVWEGFRIKAIAERWRGRHLSVDRREPAKPVTGPKCLTCKRSLGWAEQMRLCFTCMRVVCTDCCKEQLVNHRHPMIDAAFGNLAGRPTDISQRQCDGCAKTNYVSCFVGLRCHGCNDKDLCIECVTKMQNGELVLPGYDLHGCHNPLWVFWRF